jgi:RNA polymerase-binding transcription factor DksA
MNAPDNPMTHLSLVGDRQQQRRRQLVERVESIAADLRREHEPLTPDFPDQAIQRENDEVLDSLKCSAEGEVRQIDAAAARLQAVLCNECAAAPDRVNSGALRG